MSTPDDLAETVRLVEKEDRRIVAIEADVRDPEAMVAAAADGVAEFGRLDVVVANAGIVSVQPGLDMDVQTWRDVIDINLSGVWFTVRATAPHMIAGSRGGAIVVTGSTSSIKAVNGLAHYTAAKHGLVGLMKTFAVELSEHKIRANLVLPTNTDTAMLVNDTILKLFLPDIESPAREDAMAEGSGFRAATQLGVPWMDVSDISAAVLFLASDAARHITGISLPVDGGFLLK
jgi:NAD(P)-dependent dehydrogenase (short-subunit alcohol dehydrogenase family)